MSGPIVRKYGFPNFEKIFGERDLQHGLDDEATPAEDTADSNKKKETAPKAKKKASKPKKASS